MVVSPSIRRAWIEILYLDDYFFQLPSPSIRRAWIEIAASYLALAADRVALYTEGVD